METINKKIENDYVVTCGTIFYLCHSEGFLLYWTDGWKMRNMIYGYSL